MRVSLAENLCLTALCLLLTGCHAQDDFTYGGGPVPTRVKIDSGFIVGTTTTLPSATAAVNKFLGVPFAKSPPTRFEPPERVRRWREPLEAKQFKSSCIQTFTFPSPLVQEFFNNPPPPESEDCLYLNVFAPSRQPPRGGRPVLFWIYGGGFSWGAASLPFYDGSAFAAFEDVIVVTSNYRTGVFGFPGAPELPPEKRNLGLLDQRAALDWVQRNIRAFGGDPRKVTIFGESAGAASADLHITSFSSNPPFRAAILQSGQFSYRNLPAAPTSPGFSTLVGILRCAANGKPDNLTCVRDVPAEKLRDTIVANGISFAPVAEDITFVSNPIERRAEKNIALVPVLIGSNADEGDISAYGNTNVSQTIDRFFAPFPAVKEKVLQTYQVGQNGLETPEDVVSKIITEASFQCPASELTKAIAAVGIPIWRYFLAASFRNLAPRGLDLGAFHGSDIPLIFSTYPREGSTREQVELSNFMRGAWARFARNPQEGPGWNAVGSSPDVGVLGQGDSTAVTLASSEELDENCSIYEPIWASLEP